MPTARHSKAQGERSVTLGKRHRTTLPKTDIDGYGVPVRNDISANAMISRVRHCHHDVVRFYRNAVNAVAVIMQILMADPQGCATLTLGCLTLSALTVLIAQLAISHKNSMTPACHGVMQ